MNISPEDLFSKNYSILSGDQTYDDDLRAIKKAAILRQFLIDGTPLVHTINRSLKKTIFFEVDNSLVKNFGQNTTILYSPTEIGNLKLKYSVGLRKLKLSDFLHLKILKITSDLFTVSDIIKYAANKQGGVHFDTQLLQDEEALKKALDSVSQFKVLAAAIETISQIAIIALRPLKDAILTFPDYSNVLAHYNTQNRGALFFEKNQYGETNNLNTNLINGLGWFAAIKITPQTQSGTRCIYQIGGALNSDFRFSLFLTKETDISCQVQFTKKKKMAVIASKFKESPFFNSTMFLSAVLSFSENIATLRLWINKQLVSRTDLKVSIKDKRVDRHVIAGNLKGKQTATLILRELLLLKDGLSDENIQSILTYLDRQERR